MTKTGAGQPDQTGAKKLAGYLSAGMALSPSLFLPNSVDVSFVRVLGWVLIRLLPP